MNRCVRQVTEMAAMVAISALLYVTFFKFNGVIFSGLEHIQGVNWVFLPAGFRVLLVLGMGLPGAVGILLGTLWLERASFNMDTLWMLLATGLVSGFMPWLVKCVMEKKHLLAQQLQELTANSLLQFVLAYAAANALGHQFVWWALNRPGTNPWVDVWPMFVGDAIGALLTLYTLKLLLPMLLAWVVPFMTKPRTKTKPAGH